MIGYEISWKVKGEAVRGGYSERQVHILFKCGQYEVMFLADFMNK